MRRRLLAILAIVVSGLAANSGHAQPWVEKLFEEREHDFGVVARGADTIHRFPVKNIYRQDIELVAVRSSCGCTSPTLEGRRLKTGEIGYVVASFNTRTFTGSHSATLTVEAMWDDNGVRRRGETQLRVHGNVRGDVTIQPGAVKFDAVAQGAQAEQQVQVVYTGGSSWQIVDVRGASDDLEVVLNEQQRAGGRVTYEMLVRLKDTAAAGYFNEQLVLVTSDRHNPRIPLHVAGRIVPQISVAPEAILLGKVAPGTKISRKVIVRGKQPFRIVKVECEDGSFQFKTDDQASERHVVEILFDAGRDPAQVKQTIHIATDLGGGSHATFTAFATVVPDETPTAETTSDDSGASAESATLDTAGAASTAAGRLIAQ